MTRIAPARIAPAINIGSRSAAASAGLPPVHKWTVDDCCVWLSKLQLGQYNSMFRDKQIDGLTLLGIDNAKDIEITLAVPSKDHQQEMLRHLNYLRNPDVARTNQTESPPTPTRGSSSTSEISGKVALEPLSSGTQPKLISEGSRAVLLEQQQHINRLESQIEELRRHVGSKGSNAVAPIPGTGETSFHVKHGAIAQEPMSFDLETGKPLNHPAFSFTDEEKKQRPRFDTTTGAPLNKAAEVMVQQQLIKKTVDRMNIVDFDEENYVKTSLCCIERDNPLRVMCLRIMHMKWFDRFILLCIAVNALIMGLADYKPFEGFDFENEELINNGWRNQLSLVTEPIFTAIFCVECIIKVIAMGFFMGRNTYLREPWNILDFLVVVTAVLEALPGTPKLTALRTFRVLRPLRSIARFPELNTLVKAILNSGGQLLQVFFLLLAMLSIFAILAVQVFGGDGRMYGRCRLTEFPVKFKDKFNSGQNVSEWLLDESGGNNKVLANLYTQHNNKISVEFMNLGGNSKLAQAYYEGNAVRCLNEANTDDSWTKNNSPWAKGEDGCAWPLDADDTYLCNLARTDGSETGSGRVCPWKFRGWLSDGLAEADEKDVSTTPTYVPAYSTREHHPTKYNGVGLRPNTTYSFEDAWKGYCGSDYDNKGNPRYTDEKVVMSGIHTGDLNWGLTGMDHVPIAVLVLFQCATLEGWTDIMYQIGDAVDGTFSAVFFIMLVLMGGMFVLNLILAVIEQSFGDSHEGAKKDRMLARFIGVFQKLDEDGSGYLTIQELMTTDEFGHMSFGELNLIVREYDQNFDGKISQEEFVELMMAVSEGDLMVIVNEKKAVEDEPNSIMCITFNSAWCFRNNDTMYRFVMHKNFERFVIVLILVNTLVLSMYKWPQDPEEADILDTIGFFLTIAFTIEMICKLTGLGIFQYLSDSFNIVDGLIVVVSLIELAVAPPGIISGSSQGEESDSVGAFSALRTVRLFRIFKLMSAMKGLRSLVRVCLGMLSAAVNLGVLVMLFMYIFSILGMQLFANKFHFERDTGYALSWQDADYGSRRDDSPRGNFDNFVNAFLTVFQIMTGEDWNVVMYTARRAAGDGAAIVYFTIVLLLGNFVLLNLFLAILLGGMESDEDEEEEDDEEEIIAHTGDMGTPAQMMHSNAAQLLVKEDKVEGAVAHASIEGELKGQKKKTADEEEEDEEHDITVENVAIPEGTSLMILTKDNCFRQAMAKVVFHPLFDTIIIVMIITSSLMLAIDNPLWDPESSTVKRLKDIDLVFTILFAVECVMKVIVLGFAFHKGAYLRISWNQLDFLIVVISFISLLADGNASLSSLRSLRSMRALRPLRVISRYPGLKQVVNALFASIPGVFNASIITGISFLMFAIIAVSYFKGKFYACQGDLFDKLTDPELFCPEKSYYPDLHGFIVHPTRVLGPTEKKQATEYFIQHLATNASSNQCENGLFHSATNVSYTDIWENNLSKPTSKAACEWLQMDWAPVHSWNYDNVVNALVLLFEVCTTEGWVDVMYMSIDATAPDMQPIQDYNRPACLFYIVFLVTCSFFLMNLFVGVIIDNFNELKKEKDHSVLLTPAQQQWVNSQKMLVSDNALFHIIKKPKQQPAAFAWHLSSPEGKYTQKFDKFIMGCILVNTFLMAMKHFKQTDVMAEFMVNINYFFALIYTAEAIIKVLGLGWKQYISDNWNKFDFILVVITDVGLIVFWSTGINVAVLATVCRTFRVGRILRLVRGASGARAMFNTLVVALPALVNISSLLLLLFFIYAIMGVQLFAKVKMGGDDYEALALDEHANFQTFGMAMLTLLRCATGEFWNGLMYDLAINEASTGCKAQLEYDPNMCGFSTSPVCRPINGCGSVVAFPYFVSFTLFITFVTIELFTAVIMDGFETSSEQEKVNKSSKLGLSPSQYHEFCRVWLKFDPTLKWVVSLETLTRMLKELPAPVGIGERTDKETSEDSDEAQAVEADSHYTYVFDLPIAQCGIEFGPAATEAEAEAHGVAVSGSVVVTKSAVIGVDIGDILLSVKDRKDMRKDVRNEPAQQLLERLSAMKVPIEVTLLRRPKTWMDHMKSFGLRPTKFRGDKYEFNNVARALSKKVLLDQTGDDPRKVIMELEKHNKDHILSEETKLEVKWQQMKDRIEKVKR